MSYSIRFNGTAPAWPVMLGEQHPFYDPKESSSLASASCSILRTPDETDLSPHREILVDAGHETVPFLLRHGNRLPDAILLTHGHPDHVLGIDWIVQSLRFTKTKEEKMPLYCSRGTWDSLMKSWGHIKKYVKHHLLIPGRKICMAIDTGIEITPFPVFHGRGAAGASMLLFEFPGTAAKPVLFSGDLLFPMLRLKDFVKIAKADTLVVDCNNQYPYPASNHISFTSKTPDGDESELLKEWLAKQDIEKLVGIQQKAASSREQLDYWDEFLAECTDLSAMPCSILGLVRRLQAEKVYLTHYSGLYDLKVYKQKLKDRDGLGKWALKRAAKEGLEQVSFRVPRAGDIIRLG